MRTSSTPANTNDADEAHQHGEPEPRRAVDDAAELAEGALGEGDVALDGDLALEDALERGDQLAGGLEPLRRVLVQALDEEVR